MNDDATFHLQDFMPYLLNRAAEKTSLEFQAYYKAKYGMLRTEWRVLFHLGRYGALTAKSICHQADIHKTKVSRAVSALERRRYVTREQMEEDRRHELLHLTKAGKSVFDDLVREAERYNTRLLAPFAHEDVATLKRLLARITYADEGR